MNHRFRPGQLVAVTGGSNNTQIRRIARVVEDTGAAHILVETDSTIEGDAAVEYDFETPQPASLLVERGKLRPILE